MKDKYLALLKQELTEKNIGKHDIADIIKDYSQLYDDAVDSGKSPEDIEALLGDPKKVAKEVTYEYQWTNPHKNRGKIIALMPFVSVIIFMLIGLLYQVWHPTWLIFLIIPVTAIALESKGFERIIAISPFVALVSFMILGTYTNLWNPLWLIFLIIPMLAILKKKNILLVVMYELSFVLAIGFYLYMGYVNGLWSYGLFGFILPLFLGLWFQDVIVIFPFSIKNFKKKDAYFVSIILVIILSFLLLGLLLSGWGYAWQLFLFIPIAAIIIYDKPHLVALAPFVAVMIFYSLGYFFGLWTVSWLAFLLIPMAGILFPDK
ncbi:MAG: DUF1700 domain-containing protein [Acholeplasmataceae bacterium]